MSAGIPICLLLLLLVGMVAVGYMTTRGLLRLLLLLALLLALLLLLLLARLALLLWRAHPLKATAIKQLYADRPAFTL
jgi:hypothetical protein